MEKEVFKKILISTVGIVSVGFSACSDSGLVLNADTDQAVKNESVSSQKPSGFKIKAIASSSVDLSDHFPKPGNQGLNINSCVAWVVSEVKTYQEKKEENWDITNNKNIFSPAYIFDGVNANAINNTGNCSLGMTLFQALSFVKENGVASLSDMPYYENRCDRRNDVDKLISKSKKYKISGFNSINFKNINFVKNYLKIGVPVMLGIKVPKELHDLENIHTNAVLKNPLTFGKTISTHAIVLVGYDDNRKAFKFMNSWGTSFGENGFAWIDYDTFTNTTPGYSFNSRGASKNQTELVREAYVAYDSRNK